MYFDTYCDTYIIKLTPNKTELMRTLHTEDTVKANTQINFYMDSINNDINYHRNYWKNELYKSIEKIYNNGFTGNIDVVLYGDSYDIIDYYTDFNIADQIAQIRAAKDIAEEYYNTSYSVIIFKHNHFWKPKKNNQERIN